MVMKIFVRSLFKEEQLSINSKRELSTGKLPLGGFPMNSVVRITDHPNMTSAVNSGLKTTNQTEKQTLLLVLVVEAEYRILQVLSLAAINYSRKVSATYLEFILTESNHHANMSV